MLKIQTPPPRGRLPSPAVVPNSKRKNDANFGGGKGKEQQKGGRGAVRNVARGNRIPSQSQKREKERIKESAKRAKLG